MRDLGAVLDH
jgi:integrase/recombinase XerD